MRGIAIKTILTIGLALVMALSVVAAPAAAAPKEKTYAVNLTEKVGPIEVPIASLGVDQETLAAIFGMLPEDFQELLANADSIYLDGMVHVNLKVWEKGDSVIANLQFFWHGTIAILDSGDNVLMSLEARNFQVVLHIELPSGELDELSAFVNVHLNGLAIAWEFSMGVRAHVLLKWNDSELTMFKIWLPDLSDLELV